jgi:hypothetical protein
MNSLCELQAAKPIEAPPDASERPLAEQIP